MQGLLQGVWHPPLGDVNGLSCVIQCTDVTTDNNSYREVRVTVGGEEAALFWYDHPAFAGEATIEHAIQQVALALGARVTSARFDRDERKQDEAGNPRSDKQDERRGNDHVPVV